MTDVCCTGLITCPRQTRLIFSFLIFSLHFLISYLANLLFLDLFPIFFFHFRLGWSSLTWFFPPHFLIFSARAGVKGHTEPAICKNTFRNKILLGYSMRESINLKHIWLTGIWLKTKGCLDIMCTSNSFLLIQIRANDWQ